MKTWNSSKKQSKVQKGIVGTVILVILAGAVVARSLRDSDCSDPVWNLRDQQVRAEAAR